MLPTMSAEKTLPLLRAHPGRGKVLAVKFYPRHALVAWFKFKKDILLTPSP